MSQTLTIHTSMIVTITLMIRGLSKIEVLTWINMIMVTLDLVHPGCLRRGKRKGARTHCMHTL